MPSQTEASPIAALEALACNVPALISAAANMDGVLVAGQHGWEIGEVTAASIAAAIATIVTTDAATRAEWAQSARARARTVHHRRVATDFMQRDDALIAAAPPG